MISHWFTPDEKAMIRPERLSKESLWHRILFIEDEDISLSGSDLLIISLDRLISQRIKKSLYQFNATPVSALRVIDCGILHQKQPETLLPVLKEITDAGARIVILGAPISFMKYQLGGLRMASIIRESNLDDDIHIKSDFTPSAIQYIGTQRHLISESLLQIEAHLRLSDLKEDISLAEPCLRDSDALVFNCDSMSAAEAGYMTGMSSSGLSVIEACQLFRYAGAAQALSLIGIYGYPLHLDESGMMSNAIAQMIWYLLEGSTLREDPEKSPLTQYVVQLKDNEHTLLFYKSELSGRWWIENKSGQKMPCSYQDYRQACNEDYSATVIKSVLG